MPTLPLQQGVGDREAKGLAQEEHTIVSRELEYSPSLPIFIYFVDFFNCKKDGMFAAVTLTTQRWCVKAIIITSPTPLIPR